MRNHALTIAALLVTATSVTWSASSRADVSPTCDEFVSNVTCLAEDVGKACSGGGRCRSVSCAYTNGHTETTVYKCLTCPADISGTCNGTTDYGKACGDGGTCTRVPPYCDSTGYLTCTSGDEVVTDDGGFARDVDAGSTDGAASASDADAGTITSTEGGASSNDDAGAPSSGTAGSAATATSNSSAPASDGGCSVSPGLGERSLSALMIAIGAVALAFDRKRRRGS
jgi:hypothetical protein